jgi:protocatechuate 3,4-dioxygenase beta subunit
MRERPDGEPIHDHDLGLAHDLRVLAGMKDRRHALRLLAGMSLVPLIGCDSESTPGGGIDGGGNASCAVIPEETAGPYPGDGSNGANALTLSGIVRSDIRPSLSPATGTAQGIPLTVKLTLVNTRQSCAPLAGYAVYIWQCDRDGNYSMYTLATENYLRGVQITDASGTVTFTSIFPGCYPGRWPHIHFEIYPSAAQATGSGSKLKTSQLALPADACNAVYATTGYSKSITALAGITLASDNVFSDGSSLQVAATTGSAASGYVAALTVAVSV